MKPLKYKFFLTSSNQPMPLVFREGIGIDPPSGAAIKDTRYASTDKLDVNGFKFFYFNLAFPYSGASPIAPYIQFYDTAGTIVGNFGLTSSVVVVPSTASKYAVHMCILDYASYGFRDDSFFFLALDEAVPHYKKLTKKVSKESNEMFYRDSLTGDITFHNNDFKNIADMPLTSKGMFIVTRADNSLLYKQEFSKVDFEIDHFRKSAELKLKTVDAYEQVLSKQDRKFNITEIGASLERVYLRKKPIIQAYVMGGDTVSNFFGGLYEETEVAVAQSDFKTLVETNYFAYCQTVQEFEITGAPESGANGVYSGAMGIYVNANGWEINLIEDQPAVAMGSLYVYRPDQTLYVISQYLYLYQASDFSDLDIRDTYPQCIYIVLDREIKFAPSKEEAFIVGMALKNLITSHVLMRVLCDTSSITLPDGSRKDTFPLPLEDLAYSGRNYDRVIGWESSSIYTSVITTSEPTKYGINDYGQYFTDTFPTTTRKVVPLCPNVWGNASIWWDYPANFNALVRGGVNSAPVLIRHTYSLQTIISALLKKAGIPLLHYASDSKFLYSTTDPTFRATDTWKNILITPITNILKSDYTQAAQRGDISLEMIFEMLRKVFNCYWYIKDGHLKIEHLSFFLNGLSYTSASPTLSLDLTTLQDQFNRMLYTYDQQKISYDTKELPSQYVFNYSEDTSEAFTKVKLTMKNAPYVDPSLDSEVTVDNFSADIDVMLLNPDNFNKDSFALLCPEYVDVQDEGRTYSMQLYDRTITDDKGRSYTVIPQNLYASWLHLLMYHVDDIPSIQTENSLNMLINVIPTQKAFMAQSVKVPETLNVQPYQVIKTSVGIGQVESIDIELDTGVAEIQLKHKPA